MNAKGGDALGSQARPRGPQSVPSSPSITAGRPDGALVRPEDGLHEVRMIALMSDRTGEREAPISSAWGVGGA